MILLEHVAEFRCDALRADNRSTGADADNFHVGNLAQAADDVFQPGVAHHQGVAARQKHVAHLRGVADVFDSLVDAFARTFVVFLTGEAAAGAVAAVHRAHVGNQQQHAVGITVGQARRRAVLVFMQRVEQVGCSLMRLGGRGDALPAHGIVRVIRVDE